MRVLERRRLRRLEVGLLPVVAAASEEQLTIIVDFEDDVQTGFGNLHSMKCTECEGIRATRTTMAGARSGVRREHGHSWRSRQPFI
jgi:hypothetical protein